MRKLFLLLPWLFVLVTSFTSTRNDQVINYLHTPDTIVFKQTVYHLSWSSHPAENFYKQEFIPAGETSEHYTHMLLLDYKLTDTPAIALVNAKVRELIERKKTDIITYHSLQRDDVKKEYLLDFAMSVQDSHHNTTVVEWDFYHYKNYTDKAGHKGVLLVGYSERAYGNDVTRFLRGIDTRRTGLMSDVSGFGFPEVWVK